MTRGLDQEQALARQGRIIAVIIALAGVVAIIAPWLTRIAGLPLRFEMLFYLISLAGFILALAMTYQIWRKRRTNEGR